MPLQDELAAILRRADSDLDRAALDLSAARSERDAYKITVATLTAIIGAFLLLLREFGVPITEGQHEAILGFALVVAPLVVAAVARNKVTPV